MTRREHFAGLRRGAAIMAVLAAGLTACGGDDEGAASAGEPTATEPATTEPEPPDTTPTATEPPATTLVATDPATTAPPVELTLPSARSEIVPTAGDLPNGVYRFTQTVDALLAADPSGSYAANDEFIGEYVLTDGISELHYFNMDGTPMAGEPPDTGGSYQVQGDVVVFAAPPERAMPGTNGIYLLRWSIDGETLALEQIDSGAVDADFIGPWTRVGDAP